MRAERRHLAAPEYLSPHVEVLAMSVFSSGVRQVVRRAALCVFPMAATIATIIPINLANAQTTAVGKQVPAGTVQAGAIVAGTVQAVGPRQAESWTPELTMQVKRVGAVQPSPDGTLVAYVVRSAVMEGERSEYVSQIHIARADGSQAIPLTQGPKSCDDMQWSPDGKWLSFVSDRVGKRNVWLIRATGGEALQLTAMKANVGHHAWSRDGRWLAFVALDPPTAAEEQAAKEKNDARVLDEGVKLNGLYVVPVGETPTLVAEPRRLTPADMCVADPGRASRAAFDWSPDGNSIVFSHVSSPSPDHWTTADVSAVNVATGAVKKLAASQSLAETSPRYSPDGNSIALVISAQPPTWGGSGRVHVIPAGGGAVRPLGETADGFGRYSELVGWSADGKRVLVTEASGTDLRFLSLGLDGTVQRLHETPGMGLSGVQLNASRTHLGWAWETSDQPPEAWVGDLAAFAPRQVSQVQAGLAMPPLGRTEVVRWKSTEGWEVEGLLTLPVNYRKGERCPLLLVIHGGPMGVFSKSFVGSAGTYPVAVFASRGFAVLRPNPRGSSGYGHKFRHANYGDWGGGDYRDIMSGVDHVINQGIADPNRLGVMGWSYGGYMTSWTITQTKRFRCASVGAGVTNLMSFTGTADIPGFLPDYFGGEFWDRPDTYAAHSAMFQVKGVTTPTLIQHGERDERVPLSQGLELYNALKRQGCTTKMVVYPRTPHGIEEPRLLLDAMRRNVEWFEHYLSASK